MQKFFSLLFELNVKLRCQKVNRHVGFTDNKPTCFSPYRLNQWYFCKQMSDNITDTYYKKYIELYTRWRSWLRHCATSRKVAGSIPDGVIGIFYWHNSSGRIMALGLTQPLTEMSITNISWGWRQAVRRAENLTTFKCRFSWNLGASNSWNL